MRLIHCVEGSSELRLVEYFGDDIPPYAMLSHTWGVDAEEVTYQDMVNQQEWGWYKPGYDKILFCADRARHDGLEFFWIDTCCIDKTNSVELNEAINSMFDWYRRSSRCYVYLLDVYGTGPPGSESPARPSHDNQASELNIESHRLQFEYFHNPKLIRNQPRIEKQLKASKWFTRGWTLQELIAPAFIDFWSRDGMYLGTKGTLLQLISNVTGVSPTALCAVPLAQFSDEQRLSWAENRHTKRPEDKAYSLLGIVGVRMRPDYGEGRELAFNRLHRKISKLRAAQSQEAAAKDNRVPLGYGDLSPFFGRTILVEGTREGSQDVQVVISTFPYLLQRLDIDVVKPSHQSLHKRHGDGNITVSHELGEAIAKDSLDAPGWILVYCHERKHPRNQRVINAKIPIPRKKKMLRGLFSSRSERLQSRCQENSQKFSMAFDLFVECGFEENHPEFQAASTCPKQ